MSDLIITGTSGYASGAIDTASTLVNNVSPIDAKHPNGLAAAIVQVENILGAGTTLKGSVASLAARLALALTATGQVNLGTDAALNGILSVAKGGTGVTVKKGWQWVSSTSISAQTSCTLTGLTAGIRYRVTFACTTSANEHIRLRFNGDTGTVYAWGCEVTNDSTDVAGTSSGGGTSYINVTGGSNPAVNDGVTGVVSFKTKYANTLQAHVAFDAQRSAAGSSAFYGSMGHGIYAGATDVTSVALLVNSGTMTGEFVLEQFLI